MTTTTGTGSVEATLAESEQLADLCEAFDPTDAPVHPAAEYWLMRAVERSVATGETDIDRLRTLVGDARDSGTSWERIGELLSISAEAAQQQFS